MAAVSPGSLDTLASWVRITRSCRSMDCCPGAGVWGTRPQGSKVATPVGGPASPNRTLPNRGLWRSARGAGARGIPEFYFVFRNSMGGILPLLGCRPERSEVWVGARGGTGTRRGVGVRRGCTSRGGRVAKVPRVRHDRAIGFGGGRAVERDGEFVGDVGELRQRSQGRVAVSGRWLWLWLLAIWMVPLIGAAGWWLYLRYVKLT
ncbi:hypothetical protein C7458_1133 [Williamsia muralis]|nr:hypothetical protein C7458_1133 [Williamsia marianensis]